MLVIARHSIREKVASLGAYHIDLPTAAKLLDGPAEGKTLQTELLRGLERFKVKSTQAKGKSAEWGAQ
jgi:hypothetical protein